MKIFLLEDDFALNDSIKDMLEFEGFEVDSFYDGQVALENISKDYELYILDIFVPNLNGILLLEKIKLANKDSVVFIMSANIDISTIKEAYNKGCDDYLKKPFNIQELLFKLKKFNKNSDIFRFDDDILFDMKSKKIIHNNKEIELTKNERNFLHLLICNQGKCVNYSLIENVVYDGDFKTLDAIRSLIKRLRKKLPKEIIFNNLEEGYYIK
ncbi:DNA-binding response regulator [Aliarcobacter trophiarum LMG 25534]|uniref:DNA-binding response regulator n=1 Tax=Aliarcobacter trophiarum LMG 25534 TaxID=1032241 RepID=A0AAD0QHQ4_9BACT|nr:response regulator transcription factor [Aliarcobacter trophiarum]AXK48082.1 two-component system response regulator [Aliarcobacter trophiarum LMG 25534]RXI27770.1 DNA-binding response regulator [Aliarcobacter trophiarum]RXJ93238.1 DNA-binding response regulator [Aliarcobacter trophiarum LMG 25534]